MTLKDAYYEEEMGGLIDDMLLQVHILGSGYVLYSHNLVVSCKKVAIFLGKAYIKVVDSICSQSYKFQILTG